MIRLGQIEAPTPPPLRLRWRQRGGGGDNLASRRGRRQLCKLGGAGGTAPRAGPRRRTRGARVSRRHPTREGREKLKISAHAKIFGGEGESCGRGGGGEPLGNRSIGRRRSRRRRRSNQAGRPPFLIPGLQTKARIETWKGFGWWRSELEGEGLRWKARIPGDGASRFQ